jgi:adenine phosphoribosyltransferase
MSSNADFSLDAAIRKIPDFPKPGILFYDITSILTSPPAFAFCVERLAAECRLAHVEALAAIESRGFLFAAPLARELGLPIVLVRKKGKLPGRTVSASYALEYGQAEIEVHSDDIPRGKRVAIIDDLIATGGTVSAAAGLFAQNGALPVVALCVVGLPDLKYAEALGAIPVKTLIDYHGL